MSLSQLTNSYFSEGWLNHQPATVHVPLPKTLAFAPVPLGAALRSNAQHGTWNASVRHLFWSNNRFQCTGLHLALLLRGMLAPFYL